LGLLTSSQPSKLAINPDRVGGSEAEVGDEWGVAATPRCDPSWGRGVWLANPVAFRAPAPTSGGVRFRVQGGFRL
jgi:hypothetical protein